MLETLHVHVGARSPLVLISPLYTRPLINPLVKLLKTALSLCFVPLYYIVIGVGSNEDPYLISRGVTAFAGYLS